jgi:hypothetical protein
MEIQQHVQQSHPERLGLEALKMRSPCPLQSKRFATTRMLSVQSLTHHQTSFCMTLLGPDVWNDGEARWLQV